MRIAVTLALGTVMLSAEAGRLPAHTLRSCSLPWLGQDGTSEAAEVKVMSLSCAKCLDELTDVFSGVAAGPSHLILNTTDPVDQGLAWNWIAAARSHSTPARQRAIARDLLAIYGDSPAVYRADSELWRRLCREQWNRELSTQDEADIWAQSLNTLLQQNRWLALLGRHSTPDVIALDDGTVKRPDATSLDGEARRMQIWEHSEPALRPDWNAVATDRGEARPVLHRVGLDPGMDLSADSWGKLRDRLSGGGLFEWEASASLSDPVFRRWLATFFRQPTLLQRRSWFDATVAAAIDLAQKTRQRVSLMQAIEHRDATRGLPSIPDAFLAAAEFEIWVTEQREGG